MILQNIKDIVFTMSPHFKSISVHLTLFKWNQENPHVFKILCNNRIILLFSVLFFVHLGAAGIV